jgi:hypothetical protein
LEFRAFTSAPWGRFTSQIRRNQIRRQENRDIGNIKIIVGSSSKVNSPVSFATTENIEDKIKELDETMENLDLGEKLEDFMICCGSISDKSTDT